MYSNSTAERTEIMMELDASSLNRIIGRINGDLPGPTIIFVGGIHGNEPSGAIALKKVMADLEKQKPTIHGTILALAGNLKALKLGKRFIGQDLNRMWFQPVLDQLLNTPIEALKPEEEEVVEIYSAIKNLLKGTPGPFYFFDLHTTSGETGPFLTVNDSLLNRNFSIQFPAPIILGIEEYIVGPLLSYINELGYIAFGFEGGQHEDPKSVDRHEAFIRLALAFSGVLDEKDIPYQDSLKELSVPTASKQGIFEIIFRYEIPAGTQFKMLPGFKNFQAVQKHELLAMHDGKEVKVPRSGMLFMPLYQDQGEDGFFIIRRIPMFALQLSAFLRKKKIDRFLGYLPGVRWTSERRDELMVNKNIARFFTKQFFHLLGYRSRKISDRKILMRNREFASRYLDYKN